MSDQLADGAERLFAAHADKATIKSAESGTWPQALWDAVEEAGFTAALLPESAGGFGASPVEAMGLLRTAAAHAAPIPLGETMLAGWLLAQAGLAVPPGPLSLAPVRRNDALRLVGGRLSGTARRVPWGRDVRAVAVLVDGHLACVPAEGFTVTHATNVAGEPRDTLVFDAAVDAVACPISLPALRAAGAAVRTVQIAGALTQILDVCVAYVQTRVQFGRPIGKFQAIQQAMAILAGQCAAAGAAADMAAEALGGSLDPMVIGAAKARAGEAASIAAGIAHQVHGAIGFTQEYALHPLTRRLWAWRDEFGNEAEWNALVGRAALRAGADGLWPAITAAA
jgi:acyl-CoA dehydrogenase